MAPPVPHELMQRIKGAAKRLKQSVLALYYAVQHPEVSIWPKLIAAVALTYALSPVDLIPDFLPVIGFLDDIVLLPGLIALAVWLIPPHIMAYARARAASHPIRLEHSLAGTCAVFVLWDVSILLSIHWTMKYLLPLWWQKAATAVLCSASVAAVGLQAGWWILRHRGQRQKAM